jgi:hypothetical protein
MSGDRKGRRGSGVRQKIFRPETQKSWSCKQLQLFW